MPYCTRRTIFALLSIFSLTFCPLSAEENYPTGSVCLEDAPAGAAVFLDGTWIGAIPADGRFVIEQLPPGPVHLVVVADESPLFDRQITFTDSFHLRFSLGTPAVAPPATPEKREPASPRSTKPSGGQTSPVAAQPVSPEKTRPASPRGTKPSGGERQPVAARTEPPAPAPSATREIRTRQPQRPEFSPLPQVDSDISTDQSFIWPMLLLALLLPAGFILFYLLWRRRSVTRPVPATGPADPATTDEPGDTAAGQDGEAGASVAAPSPALASGPNFLEDLHHKETLFSKGFRSVKSGEEPEQVVLDLTDYRVGE